MGVSTPNLHQRSEGKSYQKPCTAEKETILLAITKKPYMQVSNIFLILLFFGNLIICGCSEDSNVKANRLYTEASVALRLSIKENKSYSDLLDSYQNAKKRIDRILSKYPSSDIAVKLSSDCTKVLGLTLEQFQEMESSLKILAESERNLLSCSLLVAQTSDNANNKISA
jgi:hypothetical protein